MRPSMALLFGALVALSSSSMTPAQEMEIAEPYKVGTFEAGGERFVGLVLRDEVIVEIPAANAALEEADSANPAMPMPDNMIALIEGYESGLRERFYAIVNHMAENDLIAGMNRPAYVHDVADVDTLAPIVDPYPGKILNAAVNFYSHVDESGTEAERAEAMRQRRENRGVPYLFLKPARGAVVGQGDEIVIPYGRNETDWEVELGAVIGREAKYVSANGAQDYVFGYVVSVDVSDRGGRPPGGFGSGSDWLVGKGHDTFAPMGPWIVPKEFYGDPMENLHQMLSINGEMVQSARAGDMIHSLWELIEYGSSIITLYPGDVLNNGTSGGTAAGAVEERGESGYLQPGEVIEASIEGIGTLRLPAVAGEQPQGLTGAQLPPVDSYEDR